jgi:alanyl-tRNA synthetase
MSDAAVSHSRRTLEMLDAPFGNRRPIDYNLIMNATNDEAVTRPLPPATFMALTADELRSRYLQFFKDRDHVVIPSAPLVPENDPSVLFTTAGMHPLVPYLLGRPHPSGKRLVDYQKCVRTTDIDEVGDSTHLTLFEMLGNWSLDDYFKNESIRWSYEFLTRPDCLNIPAELIHVSVFAGDENAPRDEEAARIWQSLGIPFERLAFLSAENNWWAAGDEGPCGPDTEIFVDMTQEPCERGAECIAGSCTCGRFFEIWNNVFMSYHRSNGVTTLLAARNVDTGSRRSRAAPSACSRIGTAMTYLSTRLATSRKRCAPVPTWRIRRRLVASRS